jgi:hypothetical protein
MAHYAILDSDNLVVNVIVGRDENEVVDGVSDWEAHYSLVTGMNVLRTSYNTQGGVHLLGGTPLRKNYAGIGYTYDEELDAFIPPKPFDSWIVNEETAQWEAPIPYPTDGLAYVWNNNKINWEATSFEAVT